MATSDTLAASSKLVQQFDEDAFWNGEGDEVARILETDVTTGLSKSEALARQGVYGVNSNSKVCILVIFAFMSILQNFFKSCFQKDKTNINLKFLMSLYTVI